MSTRATSQFMSDVDLIKAVKKLGQQGAADHFNVPRTTLQDWYRSARIRVSELKARKQPKPIRITKPRVGVRRFIFSSAQDDTKIHEQFLTNLEAYAAYIDASIHIAGFTYNKSLFTEHNKRDNKIRYHHRVEPYLTNDQFDVGGKLLFCGEMNTLPTAVRPLEGFQTYTRKKWGIFPHPRISLESIATMFKEPAKIVMTTGAVTLPNYVPKKAGIRAEFHHVIAAVLVELDDDGDIFCRHLIAEKDGSFQDLTTRVVDGEVMDGYCVEAITWGDIHYEMIDPDVAKACWGDPGSNNGIIDVLEPRYQFFHDVADFRARNHHNINDPHFRFEMFSKGTEDIDAIMRNVADFLTKTERDFCHSVVVESNHDKMLLKWLKGADYKTDPINAVFFLDCQKAQYEAIRDDQDDFSIFEHVLRSRSKSRLESIQFLRESESLTICGNSIECALHGHKGANGAKANIQQFAKMGPKANVAHTHAAAIFEGIYQAGTTSKLDLGYNRGGLSSWNHSHIVTYPSGKRIILTMQRGKAWA
jgi:hypothetical protein